MCGIVGYVGASGAAPLVFEALERLEYRGYDSAGIASLSRRGRIEAEHTTHGVAALGPVILRGELRSSAAAIGHTRWATHGVVARRNAHPLGDCSGGLSVAHNGVISNADELRAELVATGHRFTGEVDSEVIVHLLEDAIAGGRSLAAALERTVERLTGTWAIVALDAITGSVAATVHRSPLVIAPASDGVFIASDVNALADRVDTFQVLGDGDVVLVAPEGVLWWNGGVPRDQPEHRPVRWRSASSSAGAHPDHMGNEIDEQPEVARRVLDAVAPGILDGTLWRSMGVPSLADVSRVVVLGCGTSLNAGRAIGSVFSRLGRIPTTGLVASEAGEHVMEAGTLVLAISQSGETADVLRALDELPRAGRVVVALTNNPSSSLAREADAVVDCVAGPEIGVAATKTFVAQVMTGVALALSGLADARRIERTELVRAADVLLRTPERLVTALTDWTAFAPTLAAEFESARGFLFLGRGAGVVYAAEGALKLKELTYRWAEHQPAGELKHGPLALVDSGVPVFVIDSGDERIEVNIAEVAARGGRVVRVGGGAPDLLESRWRATAGADDIAPWGPLESVVPLQLFARSLALRLGRNVDKPRNLAKSVTVD